MKNKLLVVLSLSCLMGLSQINLVSDLKVCMPFNGNANDLSGLNNNGAVTNATLTTDRFGSINSAYQFNGLNTYISISSLANLAPTNELTISMWAKCDIVTSNCLFVLNPDNQYDRCVGCAQYIASPTTMIWDYGDILSGGRTVVNNVPADITNWHHYVFIVSQSGNKKQMYLDGVNNSNATYSLTCLNKNFPLQIGGGFSNGGNTHIRWNGKIDDICIYNRALNSSEVTALYAATKNCGNEITTGVEELRKFQKIIVYPTVSSDGIFNIINTYSEDQTIEIYSADGKLIKCFSLKENSKTINIESAEKGIYLLRTVGASGAFTQKVIKN